MNPVVEKELKISKLIAEKELKISKLEARISGLEYFLDKRNSEIMELKDIIKKKDTVIESLERDCEEYRVDYTELENKFDEYKNVCGVNSGEYEAISNAYDELDELCSQLSLENAALEARLKSLEKEKREWQSKADKLKNSEKKKSYELGKAEKEKREWQSKYCELKNDFDDVSRDCAVYKFYYDESRSNKAQDYKFFHPFVQDVYELTEVEWKLISFADRYFGWTDDFENGFRKRKAVRFNSVPSLVELKQHGYFEGIPEKDTNHSLKYILTHKKIVSEK